MSKAEPIAKIAVDRRVTLQESRDKATAELASLRRQREAALDALLADPASDAAANKAEQLRIKITALEGRIGTFDAAMERAEDEARAARANARVAASAASRAKVVELTEQITSSLAPAVDRAFTDLHRALAALMAAGEARAGAARHALAALHSDSTPRLHDSMAIVLPRAYSNGNDVSVAFANRVRQLVDVLASPVLVQSVAFNDFMPKQPQTISRAAEMDGLSLVEWFSDKAQPVAATAPQADEVAA